MNDVLLRIRMNGRPFKDWVPDKYSDYFVKRHFRCDMPEVLSPHLKNQRDEPSDYDDILDEDNFDADADFDNELYLSGKSVLF